MKYEKNFTKPYSGGYKDKPDKTTPVTADILNMQDNTFEAIEEYLVNMETELPDDAVINNSLIVGSGQGDNSVGSHSMINGSYCTATGSGSHAEGTHTSATAMASHSEGVDTTASGNLSHAEGYKTVAAGDGSHAEGYGTKASGTYQSVKGKFNVEDTENKYAHIVGGGTSDTDRKNIQTLDWNGNAEFAGDVRTGNGASLDELNEQSGSMAENISTMQTELTSQSKAIAELASSGISRLIVNSLPTENIKTNVIYFLPLSSVGENNIYEEYMYINEKWELIGTTQVDLSQYYTKEESNALLAEKSNKTAFENHANDKDIHVTVAEKEKWSTEDITDAEVADFLTIENSVAGGLKLNQLYGKSEQKQYSGKNLLNCDKATVQTVSGVTFTPIYDNGILQYINVNGTADANINYLLSDKKFEDGLILSGCPVGGSSTTYCLKYQNWDSTWGNMAERIDSGNGVATINRSESVYFYTRIFIKSGYTANNLKFYPMIRLASVTDTSFEPYVGGIPSPNPDYPQEIKSVVEPVVKVMGKNLLNKENDIPNVFLDASNKILSNSNGFHVCYAKINPNTMYTVSKTAGSTFRIATFENVPSLLGKFISTIADHTATKITFTSEENANYVAVGYWGNDTVGTYSSMLDSIQIEKGSTATEYEPYREQSVPLTGITLNAIPVSSGGNVTIDGQQYVADYVDVERGKVVRMVQKTVFNGSETWGVDNDGKTDSHRMYNMLSVYGLSTDDTTKKVGALCSHFIEHSPGYTWGQSENAFSISELGKALQIRKKGTLTVADWKSWLSENNITVYYPLATPTEESISDELTEKLKALQTYAGVTNIFVSSTELSPMVDFEYGLTKVGGYTLEAINMAKINAVKLNSLLSSQNEIENTTNEKE